MTVSRALERTIDAAFARFRGAATPVLGARVVDRIESLTALAPQPIGYVRVRQGLMAAALLLLGVAIWTDVTGQLRVQLGRLIIRNASVIRPALQAAVLLVLAGVPGIRRVAAMTVVTLWLPVWTYPLQAEHLVSVGRPLRALVECARSVPASQRETRVFVTYGRLVNHSFYYYPRQIGPWRETDRVDRDELIQRLYFPGRQTLVMIAARDYKELSLTTPGIALQDDVLLLMPGPFAACADAALAAGGTPIGGRFRIGKRHS